MNILAVCPYGYYQELSGSFIHNQMREYVRQGHRVRVISFLPFGKPDVPGEKLSPLLALRTADGVEIFYPRFLSLSNFGRKSGFNVRSGEFMLRSQLSRILDGFRPDVIHAHTLGLGSEIGAWLKGKLGCPLVVTTHGSDTFIPYREGQLPQLKRCADQADIVVAVSSLLQRKVQDTGTSVPIQVILNGFNVQFAESNVSAQGISVIQAGSLIERKKTDTTIRAFSQLHKVYPSATLTVIGQGPERERLEGLCRELEVMDAVHFLGQQPNQEVLKQMAGAGFFVMPSVREGFGIVYLEAMACGCVTIGTEGEGIADLIVSGENGFLVPPDDPEAIVRVVEWCLDHPVEADTIAQRGRRDALGLTWARNAQQYISLFRSLTKTEEI